VVLTLNRGAYCPKDGMQLLELARFVRRGYTRLVTITTDSLILSNDVRLGVVARRLPAPFPARPACASSPRAGGSLVFDSNQI
jgi:hypothetical protein